jgi:hypothetical protein
VYSAAKKQSLSGRDEKESEVRIQESEYPMSEVRGFKQGILFSPPRLKSGASDHDSSTKSIQNSILLAVAGRLAHSGD